MSGSGISQDSAPLRSAVSTRVRTGVSFSSAILVTRELFSLPSILVRMSEVFMTVAFHGGRESVLFGQASEQEKQLGLVNACNQPSMGQTVRKKGSGGKLLPAM